MTDLTSELNNKHNKELEYQKNEYQRGYDRMSYLEDLLAKEKIERVRSLNDQLKPIKEEIAKDFVELEVEKNARVAKEREILENLAEDSRKIEEAILEEQTERLEQQAELVDKMQTELLRQRVRIEQIKADTIGEFQKDRRDIEKEMDNRFDH